MYKFECIFYGDRQSKKKIELIIEKYITALRKNNTPSLNSIYIYGEIKNKVLYTWNLNTLLLFLSKNIIDLRRSGVESILIEEVVHQKSHGLNTALSAKQIKILASLGCDYRLIFYKK